MQQLDETMRTQLAEYLTTTTGAMPFQQVEGYLFALICSPDPVEPHTWLSEVLGSQDADESILFALMALHHEISEAVYASGFNLPGHLSLNTENCESNFAPTSPVHLWSLGFTAGSHAYVNKLLSADALTDELKEPLLMACNAFNFFSDFGKAKIMAKQNGLSLLALSEAQFDMMGDFALGFAELIEMVAVASGLYQDEGWD